MQIEAGKYYRTRGGQVFGPMVRAEEPTAIYNWRLSHVTDETSWDAEGVWRRGWSGPFDLVAEVYVSDTPPADAPSPEAKTLRDEFAMVALSDFMSQFRENTVSQYAACGLSYDWADAMMEARKK